MRKKDAICGFKQPPTRKSSLDSILTVVIHGYVTFKVETIVARFSVYYRKYVYLLNEYMGNHHLLIFK